MDIFCRITLKKSLRTSRTQFVAIVGMKSFTLFIWHVRSEWAEDRISLDGVGLGVGGTMRLPICYSERTESPSNSNKHLAVHVAAEITHTHTQKKDSIWSGEWAECVSVWPVLKGSADMTDRWEDNRGKRGIEWGVDARVSVYMCRENRCSHPPLFCFFFCGPQRWSVQRH